MEGATAHGHEIGQLNVARLKASLDSPLMRAFVERLDEINALAEQASGFRTFKQRFAAPQG